MNNVIAETQFRPLATAASVMVSDLIYFYYFRNSIF